MMSLALNDHRNFGASPIEFKPHAAYSSIAHAATAGGGDLGNRHARRSMFSLRPYEVNVGAFAWSHTVG